MYIKTKNWLSVVERDKKRMVEEDDDRKVTRNTITQKYVFSSQSVHFLCS